MVAENNLSWSGTAQQSHLSLYTQAASLANCRQSLNTAWLVMHSPYLKEQQMGSACISHKTGSLLFSVFSLSTQPVTLVYVQQTLKPQLHAYPKGHCQHNCYPLYRCISSGFPFWLVSSSPWRQLATKLYKNLIVFIRQQADIYWLVLLSTTFTVSTS